ncbi:hypothetical protein DYH55_13290 [Methylovirgula sp. 4M-Z18]|nr:hypothetical protein DYH55_13290 [Methylovirgula sp. 4M-Z18]
MIRQRGLEIAVGQTRFFGCEPSDASCAKRSGFAGYHGIVSSGPAYCASACSFLFAGGVKRYVGVLARIGVHQTIRRQTHVLTRYMVHFLKYPDGHRVEVSRQTIGQTRWTDEPEAETSAAQYRDVAAYLKQMGIGDGVLPLVLATPNTSIHWMTSAELFDTSMATDRTDAAQLIARLGRDQLAAYHASPDYRTVTLAHATLPMGQGSDGPVLLSLDFTYRRNDGAIRLAAMPTSNGRPFERPPLDVSVTMPKGQVEVASVATRQMPSDPLTVSIPKSEFCDLAQDGMVRIEFESGRAPNETRLSLVTNAQIFSSMPGLLKEACGEPAPTQAPTPTHANVALRDGGTSPKPSPAASAKSRLVPATSKSLDGSDSQRLW